LFSSVHIHTSTCLEMCMTFYGLGEYTKKQNYFHSMQHLKYGAENWVRRWMCRAHEE